MAKARATSDAATKARVLRAATELFAERGFHATKVRDIAGRARANVAAGHYHFGSKRDLYVEVLRAAFHDVRALLARRGVRPDATAVGRMSPRAVVALLERRLLVMLEMLLGPPPSLHGALVLREMLDPSEALPILVDEFVRPMRAEMADIVRALAPHLAEETVTWCVASVMGQAIFYRLTLPAILRVLGQRTFSTEYQRRLAAHVATFSIGGIDAIAREDRRAR